MRKLGYKISIVVSVYKVEGYVDKCIQSLRNQTYKNIEIVLVVRDSGDRCVEICKAHQDEDNRIILVHQTGKGLVNARKIGTLSATGDYIIHIDGDDWVENNWLENATRCLERNNPDMVYLSGLVREEGENRACNIEDIEEKYFTDEKMHGEIFQMFMDVKECFRGGKLRWNVWSWIVKGDLLRQQQMLIDDDVYLWEDGVYVFLCLISARSVALIHTGNYHYVIHDDSGMHTPIGIREGNLELAYRILKENFQRCKSSFDFERFLTMTTSYAVFRWEYNSFFPQFEEYLYPYSKVKAGSKVIVYGAGWFGRQVVEVLADRSDYSLVGWVDQNVNKMPCRGIIVQLMNDVLEIQYDYIVIAVLTREIALEIRNNLMQLGISDEKIALMDAKVISDDKLPWYKGN